MDGSVLLVCDLGHGLSEFCTKAFQEWYAVIYSVLSDRIIWECMFCCITYIVSLCMGDLLWRWWPCGVTGSYVFIFWKTRYFQLYLTCKNLLFELFFPHFWGFYFFVCFLQCCLSQSMLGAKWSYASCFLGNCFYYESKGGWKGGKECAWHCQ